MATRCRCLPRMEPSNRRSGSRLTRGHRGRSTSTHSLQAGLTVQALGGVLCVIPACPQTSQDGLRAITGIEGPRGRLRLGTVGSTTLRRPRSNVVRVVGGMAGRLEKGTRDADPPRNPHGGRGPLMGGFADSPWTPGVSHGRLFFRRPASRPGRAVGRDRPGREGLRCARQGRH